MKKAFYIFPLLVALGCGKSDTPAPGNTGGPVGTFAGPFMYLHKHSKTGVVDTVKANIILSMQPTVGFKVTGDTSTVHAGSFGTCVVNSTYGVVDFMDSTYPATGTPAKTHLNGVYQYAYDGTTFQLAAHGALDTTAWLYNLKRTGN